MKIISVRCTAIITLILLLPTLVTSAVFEGRIWGKRIWEQKIDDQHSVVVDERGLEGTMQGLQYFWRLVSPDKTDGTVLFTCSGVVQSSNTGTMFKRVEVIYTALQGMEFVTVFNQSKQCWAFVSHRNAYGELVSEPDTAPLNGRSDIGPTMKSADVKLQADGYYELTVTDDKGKSFRFQLNAHAADPKKARWEKVDGAATTRPGNLTAVGQSPASQRAEGGGL